VNLNALQMLLGAVAREPRVVLGVRDDWVALGGLSMPVECRFHQVVDGARLNLSRVLNSPRLQSIDPGIFEERREPCAAISFEANQRF
jgi:hypothetical protein